MICETGGACENVHIVDNSNSETFFLFLALYGISQGNRKSRQQV